MAYEWRSMLVGLGVAVCWVCCCCYLVLLWLHWASVSPLIAILAQLCPVPVAYKKAEASSNSELLYSLVSVAVHWNLSELDAVHCSAIIVLYDAWCLPGFAVEKDRKKLFILD